MSTSHRLRSAPTERDAAPTRSRRRRSPAARPTGVQAKLTLGSPGDRYEREADSVAKQVMASLASPAPTAAQRQPEEEELMASRLQRQPEEEELMASRLQRQPEEEELLQGKLQLKSAAEPGPVDSALESQIRAARSGGQPLPASVRRSMEGALGADFSDVRVHTGGTADALNRSLQARAFTTGRDIFFRQGEYDPAGRAGQELIAHELTHVMQQGGAQLGVQRRQWALGETKQKINEHADSMEAAKKGPGAWYDGPYTDRNENEYWRYNCGLGAGEPYDSEWVDNDTRNSVKSWWSDWWSGPFEYTNPKTKVKSNYENVKYMTTDADSDTVLFNFHLYSR